MKPTALSPGLTLYRLAANAAGPLRTWADRNRADMVGNANINWPPRPEGRVIWLQATEPERTDALMRFAERAAFSLDDATILVTHPEEMHVTTEAEGVFPTAQPIDCEGYLRPFLSHWTPDIAVFTGGTVGPVTMQCCERAGVPSLLVDARLTPQRQRLWTWAPLASRAVFQGFTRILASSAAHADVFEQLGADPGRVEVTGALEEGSIAPGCNLNDLEEMGELTARRPVWLAARVSRQELPMVLAAHSKATRSAHRLLLILVPDADVTRDDIAIEGPGRTRYRSDLTEPDDDTSIYVADTEGEMGLWYRIAPVSFLGHTLVANGRPEDPFGPAALGSAMVHGPHTGDLNARFERFRAAGASRLVGTADELAAAVSDLQAPDRAADLAHRSWQVASKGADVSDRVIQVIQDTLDRASR